MRKYAEIDKPAIYRKMRINHVQVRTYTSGYPYSRNGLLMRSSAAEPVHSYAKNFTKFKKEFSLFMWTSERDQSKVEAHFDKVVKGLKREQIMEVINNIKSFSYVEPNYSST